MSNPARFGELLAAAQTHLGMAEQTLKVGGTAVPGDPHPARAGIQEVAAALHALGAAVGSGGPGTDQLATTLNRTPDPQPGSQMPGLSRAATLIRAAAELLDGNGPIQPGPGARNPRPDHLTDPPARAGAWSAVAALTESLAGVAAHTPSGNQIATELAAAAAPIPRAGIPAAMATATPAPGMPVPAGVGNELAARIHEVTQIAYRMSQPNPGGHPAGTLSRLAGFALAAHRASPGKESVIRARQWGNILAGLNAITTPTNPAPKADRHALTRATALLTGASAADLAQARAATVQIAAWITPAVTTLGIGTPAYADGVRIPELLAAATPNLSRAKANRTVATLGKGDTSRLVTMLSHARTPTDPEVAATARLHQAIPPLQPGQTTQAVRTSQPNPGQRPPTPTTEPGIGM